MNITVKTLQQESYNIDVTKDTTIKNIKTMLSKLANVSTETINLIYLGKVLNDKQKIFECDIDDEHTLLMYCDISKKEEEVCKEENVPYTNYTNLYNLINQIQTGSNIPINVTNSQSIFANSSFINHFTTNRNIRLSQEQIRNIVESPNFFDNIIMFGNILNQQNNITTDSSEEKENDDNESDDNENDENENEGDDNKNEDDDNENKDDDSHRLLLTQTDLTNINELSTISQLSRNEVLQIYIACDRNKQLAANIVFNRS